MENQVKPDGYEIRLALTVLPISIEKNHRTTIAYEQMIPVTEIDAQAQKICEFLSAEFQRFVEMQGERFKPTIQVL